MSTERIVAYLKEHGPAFAVDMLDHFGVERRGGGSFFRNALRTKLIIGEKMAYQKSRYMRYWLIESERPKEIIRPPAVVKIPPAVAGVFRFNDPFELGVK